MHTGTYAECMLCPRRCKVDRVYGKTGVCSQSASMRIARVAPHFWEEPCISGTGGSGAVFFAGCSLRCSYCQNSKISRGGTNCGTEISVSQLADRFLRLQEQGVHNINLVTASQFAPSVIRAVEQAKKAGLILPVVWNTSGYESLETLGMLDGLIDIYLPDCKYVSAHLSGTYSGVPDYFEVCASAVQEMVRQTGPPLFREQGKQADSRVKAQESGAAERIRVSCSQMSDELDAAAYNARTAQGEEYEGPLMVRGTIIRHLALPGGGADSRRVLKYLYETFGDTVYISLMAQYTPPASLRAVSPVAELRGKNAFGAEENCELDRRLREEEYEELVQYALDLGIENAFLQSLETADESFIPEWDEL